jgi:methyl-accepting chemotaxis protein
MILVTGFGVIIVLFFAKMMYNMTGYVGQMSSSVSSMSTQLVHINKKIDKMNDGMYAMKGYMGEMNGHVEHIQSDMAKDITIMSQAVEGMNKNMNSIKTDVKDLTPGGMFDKLTDPIPLFPLFSRPFR